MHKFLLLLATVLFLSFPAVLQAQENIRYEPSLIGDPCQPQVQILFPGKSLPNLLSKAIPQSSVQDLNRMLPHPDCRSCKTIPGIKTAAVEQIGGSGKWRLLITPNEDVRTRADYGSFLDNVWFDAMKKHFPPKTVFIKEGKNKYWLTKLPMPDSCPAKTGL